jgi:hypothetical protein
MFSNSEEIWGKGDFLLLGKCSGDLPLGYPNSNFNGILSILDMKSTIFCCGK